MDDVVNTYQNFLYDLANDPAVRDMYNRGSVLMEMLEREAAERKAEDDAYLATLTPAEFRRVLVDRRIKSLEARYRNWWEENMAWRLRPYQPDREDW